MLAQYFILEHCSYFALQKLELTDISSCTTIAFFTDSFVVMVVADITVAMVTGDAADGNWQPFCRGILEIS